MKKLNFDSRMDNTKSEDEIETTELDPVLEEELNYLPSYQAYIKQHSCINEF